MHLQNIIQNKKVILPPNIIQNKKVNSFPSIHYNKFIIEINTIYKQAEYYCHEEGSP